MQPSGFPHVFAVLRAALSACAACCRAVIAAVSGMILFLAHAPCTAAATAMYRRHSFSLCGGLVLMHGV